MPSCSEIITASRFKPRLPVGRHDLVFKVVFGSDAAAAKFFRVSKMTIWRWRHDRAPLPKRVVDELPNLIHGKVAEAHLAQTVFRDFLALAPKPDRPLSGCCAGRDRRVKKIPVTAEDWAALGD
jgi:hypothetical protein